MIVMLTVVQHSTAAANAGGSLAPERKARVGTLFMVDLAGAENNKKSGSTGVTAQSASSAAGWCCLLSETSQYYP